MRRIVCSLAVFALMGDSYSRASIVLVGPGNFGDATIEAFNDGPLVEAASFTYGAGFSHLAEQTNLHRYTDLYRMGQEPKVSTGRGGAGDGYFATNQTPTTFIFDFSALGGIRKFGFYGAEAVVIPPSLGRNGELDIDFLDAGSNLLASIAVNTAGTFAWDQFHGFESTSAPIVRVRFSNVGHMVLDDLQFVPVPEPSTYVMAAMGIAALLFARRRKSSK